MSIGTASGVRTEALITAMDAPLGTMVGNAMEVIESLEVLKGRGPKDTTDLSVALAARMLVLSGVHAEEAAAEQAVRDAIGSGAGLDVFRRIIENQGGDPSVIDDYGRLPSTPHEHVVKASRAGFVVLHAELVGRAAVALGAGRERLEDRVDPAVGIEILAPQGTQVQAGDAVLRVRYRGDTRLEDALRLLDAALRVDEEPPVSRPLILERITHG